MKSFLSFLLILSLNVNANTSGLSITFDKAVRMDPIGRMNLIGQSTKLTSFIPLYTCGLYVPHGRAKFKYILDESSPKRIEIIWQSPLGFDTLSEYFNSELTNILGEEQFIRKKRLINKLLSWMKDVKRGTRISLEYYPDAGTRVIIDGEKKGQLIGAEINRGLMRIWVNPDAVNDPFQKELLQKASTSQ